MLPGQSYCCGLENYWNQVDCVQEPTALNVMDSGVEPFLSSATKTDNKSTDSVKSHKEAERRRRQRINAHLSTLRTLLPKTTKKDKTSLLAEVVHHMEELRKQADDVTFQVGKGTDFDHRWLFPGESNEATLSYCENEARMIRASVCCEDRSGLNRELSQAIRSVQGRVVRAEMSTVGGRTKSGVLIEWASGSGGDEEVRVLKRALKGVVEGQFPGFGVGQAVHGSKRARVMGFFSG